MPTVISAQTISKNAAMEDVVQFRKILVNESSYLFSKEQDLNKDLEHLINSLQDTVEIERFYYALMEIVGNIGDRHARVKWDGLKSDEKGLPFIMAPMDNKIIALKKEQKDGKYQIYQSNYPELKSINGIPISEFIDKVDWAYKYAPAYAKIHRFSLERNFEYLLTSVFGKSDLYAFTFTNGNQEKILQLKLENNPKRWTDLTYKPNITKINSLFSIKGNNIGYISIPAMVDRTSENGNLYRFVDAYMHEYKNTDALIIDLRNNGGGTRQFLMQLAPYFLAPDEKPWVANIAKIRSDQVINEDMESMKERYLYNYKSENLKKEDRSAIDSFMNNFKPIWKYDPEKYSDYFYMTLRHDMGVDHYYYNKPIYVLVNERSFSAASVFTTAVKGMGNVKIAGVTTDGSSGRSQGFDLNNSKINLKLSSMISFQRNGTTLDTYGTEPDIIIQKDMNQILGQKDTQLEKLVEYIEQNKLK